MATTNQGNTNQTNTANPTITLNPFSMMDPAPDVPIAPFFKLSRELRDIIYHYVFDQFDWSGRPCHRKFIHPYDSFPIDNEYYGQEIIHGAVWCPANGSGYGLLSVCDQIRDEAMPIALRSTDVDLRWHVKRNSSTSGWRHHHKADPWMESIAFIRSDSLALRNLFYSQHAANIRYVTVQFELLEHETWSHSERLKWWPEHVRLEKLTLTNLLNHNDRVLSLPWYSSHSTRKLLDIWCSLHERRVAKELLLETQALARDCTSENVAESISESCTTVLRKETVGSLPTEILIRIWPTLDTGNLPERLRDAKEQGHDLPVTVAVLSIVERKQSHFGEDLCKVLPRGDGTIVEASLIKPFAAPRPKEHWEFFQAERFDSSYRLRHKRMRRRRRFSMEGENSDRGYDGVLMNLKDDLIHKIDRAACQLKKKQRIAMESGESRSTAARDVVMDDVQSDVAMQAESTLSSNADRAVVNQKRRHNEAFSGENEDGLPSVELPDLNALLEQRKRIEDQITQKLAQMSKVAKPEGQETSKRRKSTRVAKSIKNRT